jgi:hypothetical protein
MNTEKQISDFLDTRQWKCGEREQFERLALDRNMTLAEVMEMFTPRPELNDLFVQLHKSLP